MVWYHDAVQPVIRATRLVKRYGDLTAVDGIDLEVRQGEVFGLLGPNGAGKTSTIRMTTCVSPVDGGQLLVDGIDVAQDPRAVKRLLGVVQQEDNLDTDLDVVENLLIHARYHGIGTDEARPRAMEVLETMDLGDRARSAVDELSGGMRRRLMIARALMNRPKVLILDEPTTGLDPHARHVTWQRIRLLKDEGVTMALSTHYMEEAAHLCDRIAIIDQGRILAEGTPGEVVERFAPGQVVEVRLAPWDREEALTHLEGSGHTFADAVDALLFFGLSDGAPDVGVPAERLRVITRPGSLEDVFLLLTGRRAGLR